MKDADTVLPVQTPIVTVFRGRLNMIESARITGAGLVEIT